MDISILENIGLTRGESKVYLALLKKGLSTVGKLVDESNVSRSKIYEVLERLQTKGLVSSIKEEGVKKFKAMDPRIIEEYLENKKQELEQQKEELNKIMPVLLSQTKQEIEEQIEVFKGWKSIQNLFNLLIKDAQKGDIWHSFGIPTTFSEKREIFFKQWRKKTDKIGIQQKLIANKKLKNSEELAPKSKYSNIKYSDYDSPTSVDIFKNQVIIGIWSNKPIAVYINGDKSAQSFRTFFNQLWKIR